MRDGLERLAEPHVVGEDAAHAEGAEMLEPRQPLQLIAAQGGVDPLRLDPLRQRRRAGQDEVCLRSPALAALLA